MLTFKLRELYEILEFHWLIVSECLTVFMALNGMLPTYLSEKFTRFSSVHSRKTKNSSRNLILPQVKEGLEGYFRDPGFDQNAVRDPEKRKIA